MSESIRALLQSALTRAHDDSLTQSRTCEPFTIPRMRTVPVNHAMGRFVDSILRANALRESAQKQAVRLIWSLGVLARGLAGQQKPRVHLWAELNQRDTLELYFSAEAENGRDSYELPRASVLAATASTWPYANARRHLVFRAGIGEYINSDLREFCTGQPSSEDLILEDALINCLGHLVDMFKQVSDVTLGAWPRYTDRGVLTLRTVDQRVITILSRDRPTWEKRRVTLDGLIADRLRKHRLASVEEFEALSERAAIEKTKVTALIFSEKGVRCSSIGTDKLAEHIANRKASERDLVEFDQVLAALTARERPPA